MRRYMLLFLACIAIAQPAAYALDVTQFRQLVALGDQLVGETLGESVAWLPTGKGVVIGGWERWPHVPAIIVCAEPAAKVSLDSPATPHFAMSPDGEMIAYWVATGNGWCQLALTAVRNGARRYVGDPVKAGPAMHLAWPSQYTLVALMQDGEDCTAVAINTATGARRPMVQVRGGQWVRLRQWLGWDPVAVWAGNEKRCFRLSLTGRPEEVSPDFDDERPSPDSALYCFFDADASLWLGGLPSLAPVRLAQSVGAACWSPDGSLLAYASNVGMWCAWPPTQERRQIVGTVLDGGGPNSPVPLGMSWAPDGSEILYWRAAGQAGQVRRVQLGLEEVTIRVRYPKDARPQPGQQVWVASKLHFDSSGRVKEPVWKTLKGQFLVRRILPGVDGAIAEAVSIGTQARVLSRISKPGPEAARTASRAELAPLPGLFAWVQGTQWAGELVGVEVRRAPLGGGPGADGP